VQRRGARLIDKCRGFEYGERFTVTKLMTLETRAIWGDMIEVFKIMNGWESVLENDFFRRDESGRRGHTFKLFKTHVRLDMAKFSFGNSVCEQWNHLPGDVVSSSVNIFKGRLENYLRTITT